jgi:alkanesulfonate monooxygenase SsuD/methylene tetrahydromethanopterin reductase-like flavin-dependent oxidoreductase (luciferase family)
MEGRWSQLEASHVGGMTRCSAVGSPATIRREIEALLQATAADEIISTAQIFDHGARLHSFEIAANVIREIPV